MGDLWLWFVVHLLSLRPSSLLCEREDGTGKGKEKKERRITIHRIQKFARLSAICTMARNPSNNWG